MCPALAATEGGPQVFVTALSLRRRPGLGATSRRDTVVCFTGAFVSPCVHNVLVGFERRTSDATALMVGRDAELLELLDVLNGAAMGSPLLMLVRGEAGVGKTTLARAAAERARGLGFEVLWGSGLRLAVDQAPYVSLTTAFQRRLSEPDHGAGVREAVTRVPGAGWLFPEDALDGTTEASTTGGSISAVGALLFRLSVSRPALLVVDDVQWADPATRDVLAYLVAGFAGQRLAVIAVYREEQGRPTEEFGMWLADMRRMPGVRELGVRRLARDSCDSQVLSVLGPTASPQLLADVYRSSQGNPYLTDLLLTDIRDDRPVPDSLPHELPSALSDALLAAWARLSAPAQELSRVLAVGGSPAVVGELEYVSGQLDGALASSGVLGKGVAALREAMAAGLVVRDGDTVWFRHPLLADVLVASYLPGEAAPVHAAWAAVLESGRGEGLLSPLRRETALARHNEAAGRPDEAFASRLRAANLAEKQGEVGTTADHLVHAVDLWDVRSADAVADPSAPIEFVDLLESAALVCMRSDRAEDAHRLLTRALPMVDDDPLRTSRFTVELLNLEWELGMVQQRSVDRARAAVELARAGPDSVELAEALAYLVYPLLWDSRPEEARRVAQEAYEVAVRSGSRSALSQALSVSATRSPTRQGPPSCRRGVGGSEGRRRRPLRHVGLRRAINLYEKEGRLHEVMPVHEAACAHAIANGRGAGESAELADAYLMLGDLGAAADALRDALARRGAPTATAFGPLRRRHLAVRRGDLDAARQHRARALEVLPNIEHRIGGLGRQPLAELDLAQGDATAAIGVVSSAIPDIPNHHLTLIDELYVWGSAPLRTWRATRTIAATRQGSRPRTPPSRACSRSAQALAGNPSRPGPPTTKYSPRSAPSSRLSDTDFSRAWPRARARWRRRRSMAESWRHAAEMCSRADLRWDENYALWRLGTVLVTSEGATPEAKVALRSAYAYAVEQGAVPLRRAIEETAGLGRISLDAPTGVGEALQPHRPHAMAGSPSSHRGNAKCSGTSWPTALTPRSPPHCSSARRR